MTLEKIKSEAKELAKEKGKETVKEMIIAAILTFFFPVVKFWKWVKLLGRAKWILWLRSKLTR